MSNNPLTAILTGVLGISALASAGICYKCVTQFQQAQGLQAEVNYLKTRELLINALLRDSAQYAEKNPAINPLLQSFNTKSASNATPARPAGK
jgi:hypothetical protein